MVALVPVLVGLALLGLALPVWIAQECEPVCSRIADATR
jgi:hypothetical protein